MMPFYATLRPVLTLIAQAIRLRESSIRAKTHSSIFELNLIYGVLNFIDLQACLRQQSVKSLVLYRFELQVKFSLNYCYCIHRVLNFK